jgi:peptidyl-tRNA hydrolase, PTH2 family
MEAKQVIVIRRDLKMRRGKEIAQGSHASMEWLTQRVRGGPAVRLNEAERSWLNNGNAKVVCQVDTEAEFRAVIKKAADVGVRVHVITDMGRTEFHGVETVTALAVGPDWADRVDEVTGELKLY